MTATISAKTARGKGAICCHQLWQSGCSIAVSNDLNFGSRQQGQRCSAGLCHLPINSRVIRPFIPVRMAEVGRFLACWDMVSAASFAHKQNNRAASGECPGLACGPAVSMGVGSGRGFRNAGA